MMATKTPAEAISGSALPTDVAKSGMVSVTGLAHNGKPCRLTDHTGTVTEAELAALLRDLIVGRHFGLRGMSARGEHTIRLGEPEFSHIQLGDRLYRLLVFAYEARLEPF